MTDHLRDPNDGVTGQDYPRPLGASPQPDAPASPLLVDAKPPRDTARYYAVKIMDAESRRDAAWLAYATALRALRHGNAMAADVTNEGHAWHEYVRASADLAEWRSRWLAEFDHV